MKTIKLILTAVIVLTINYFGNAQQLTVPCSTTVSNPVNITFSSISPTSQTNNTIMLNAACVFATYLFTNGDTIDYSSNNFNLTSVNSPQQIIDRLGNPNSAYSFDTSSYMIYTQNGDLGLSGDFSYSAWINIDTLINDTNIFTFVFDTIYSGSTIFGIGIVKGTQNELIFAHDTSANNPEIINTEYYLYPNVNYHITVTRDDATKVYTLYVNNIKINEYTYNQSVMPLSSGLQGITINSGEAQMAIDAIIDDINIYSCVIDSVTVDSLYHDGGYTNNDNCQIVNWQFNSDNIDISGNNYNGMFFEPNPQFTEDRFGNPSSAYLVDTANAFAYGSNYGLGLENSLSYSFWLNIDTLINDTCLISIFIEDQNLEIIPLMISVINDTLFLWHSDTIGSSEEIATNYVIEKNQFNHFVINRDNDNKEYTLYVNNQLEGNYPYTKNPYTLGNGQVIMLSYPDIIMGFNGIIDDVIVYNCLIDTATIDSLYNIGNWQCNDFMIDSVDVLDAVCGMLNGSGEVYVSGGSGEYSYLWSNGDTLSYTDSLEAGTNSILVTDTIFGCTQTYYFSIQNIGAPTITANTTDITCNGGNNGAISTTVTGGAIPYTYNWSTGEHTTDLSGLYAGTYELSVIDGNGCIATQQIELTQPDALELSFTTTNSSCGASDGSASVVINGGTVPYTLSWTSNPLINLSAGAYGLTVTDANGCQITGSAMVSDNGAPIITVDSITPASCGVNGQVYVTINNATSPTYEWNGTVVPNTDNLTGQSFSTNILTVNDGSCTAMEDISIPYTLPDSQEICMVTVDSLTGANLIVWEKPSSTIIDGYMIYRETSIPNEYLQIGYTPYNDLGVFVDSMAYPWIRSYKYKIASKDFCDMISEKSEAHKTIHVNLNVGYLSNTVNLIWDDYEGFPYTSFNIIRFDQGTGWNDVAGSPLPNTLHSITADVLMTTSMFAITVDKPGTACLATKTSGGPYNQSISNIDDYGIGTIIESVKSYDEISIYPNPANELVNIKSKSIIDKIEISDISGQIIYRQDVNSVKTSIFIKNYTKGIYIIKIQSNNRTVIEKLVVK